MSVPENSERLRSAGLRVTRPRLIVLAALGAGDHLAADQIHARLDAGEEVSLTSVHNVLRDLTAASLVRRIEPADSAALYELRVGDNHHHAVCRGCGAVSDVDCVTGEAPCLHAVAPAGFEVDLAEVVFWGWCAACRTGGARAAGRADASHPTESHPIESPRRSPHVAHHHE